MVEIPDKPKLVIQHGGTGRRRKVTISYKLVFTDDEVTAGAVFREQIYLKGEDWWEGSKRNPLIGRLQNNAYKVTQKQDTRERSFQVGLAYLDEDVDVLDANGDVLAKRDEVFAVVRMDPYENTDTAARKSNIEKGQWGRGGTD